MVKMAGLGLAFLMLGGCITTGATQKTPDSGIDGTHAAFLAQQYQSMALLYQANSDGPMASLFNARATSASRGRWILPEPVPVTRPDGPAIPNPVIHEAREDLLLGLKKLMNAENALWLARAQVNYDCWALQADETCRQDFEKAMRGLTLPGAGLETQAVYFEADSSVLSPETYAALGEIVGMLRANRMVNIRLVGSTDHATQNASLALRRAIAVRNVLAQMGLPPDRMAVNGEDHSDTILSQQTKENTGNAEKRRVDIILEPVLRQGDHRIDGAGERDVVL